MKKSLLELDPQADALLILQRPNLLEVYAHQEKPEDDKVAETESNASPQAKQGKPTKQPTNIDQVISLQPYQENGEPNEIQFRVSSKHLCMVSPVFRGMIQGKFRESQPNNEGLLEIRASDWNASALLILLDIIHSHHRDVPRELDPEIVAQVAFLIDYYDCLEVVEVFSDRWFSTNMDWWQYDTWGYGGRRSAKPFGPKETVLLFIAWAFRREQVFANVTSTAIFNTKGIINQSNLPIPDQVLEKIDEKRIKVIDQLFSRIYDLQGDLIVGRVGCSLECSCRLLGYLMKEMSQRDLPMTKPEKPFIGYSVYSVAEIIRSIKTPVWRTNKNVDPCKLEKRLDLDPEVLDKSVRGLSLDAFK